MLKVQLLMVKNGKLNHPWWSVSSLVCSQESLFQAFPLLEWLALTAFPLHFVLQGLFIFLIDGVYNPEVSLLGVAQGWQSEWEKWQVSYLDNRGTKLAFHLSVLLPFMLGLTYMHPSLLLKTLAPWIKGQPHFSLALTDSLLLPEVFEFSVFTT